MTRRARVPISAIAGFASVVIVVTGLTVVVIRLVTDSWATGGIVGVVAAAISAIGYPWLIRKR